MPCVCIERAYVRPRPQGILRSRDWDESVALPEHTNDKGTQAAVLTALRGATGDDSAILHADLEYEPSDIGVPLPFGLHERTPA